MTIGDKHAAQRARTKRLTIAAAVVLLLSCGFFGSLFYLRRQAETNETQYEKRIAAERVALEPTDVEFAKRVQHLSMMRDKWRPWALQHKTGLKRMLTANANDRVALKVVYDAVPAIATDKDAGFSKRELRSGPVRLTWQPGSKLWAKFKSSDFKLQKRNDEEIRNMETKVQKDFTSMRDIELSTSINTGRSRLSLWASGRITKSKWIENPNPGPGAPSLVQAPLEEIEPSYDFLK